MPKRAAGQDRPLRILFMPPQYFPWLGGLEFLTRLLVRELHQRGHTLSVITAQDGDEPTALDELDGIPVLRTDVHTILGRRDRAGLLRTQRTVVEHIRQFAPDIIHGHDVPAPLWLYLRSGGERRASVVLTLHIVMSRHLADSVPALRILRTLLLGADLVTGVSQAVVSDAVAFEPSIADRISVVPNGIEPPRRQVPSIPESPPRILCIGRIVEQKRFDRAVDALAIVARRVPDVRLTVVGDGPAAADLDRQAAALGVGGLVEQLGRVDHDQVLDALASATLVMMPSQYEGLPLVALEAAWMARPVVASRVPGLEDAVIDGETGLLVEPDAESLAAAALRLIEDRSRAQAMGLAGRRRAEREWALATCADRYEAIYRSCSPAR